MSIYSGSIYAEVMTSKHHCFVDATSMKKQDALYIDTRSENAFQSDSLPNSINVPLDLIKTKTFLKDKNLILLGTGWNDADIIETCVSLKKIGFRSIKVLSGGIVSFFKNMDDAKMNSLVILTSKDFLSSKFEKKFVPFVISNKSKEEITAILPHARIFSPQVSYIKLLRTMTKLGKSENSIVIFNEENHVVDTAITDYLKNGMRSIYKYKGGLKDYKKMNELNKITSMSNQRQRLTTKKPVSCAY